MRRLIIIGTAAAVLVGAAAAYANFDTYGGSNLAISRGAGTAKKPVGLSMVETIKVHAPAGHRAAPENHILLKIYGVKLDVGKLPVCTDAMIVQNKANPDGNCPAGSVIGDGPTNAFLGPQATSSNSAAAGVVACNPYIHVFNGGPSTQVLYYYTKSATDCHGLTTGATDPFDAHISYSNGWAVIDLPVPADLSTNVAHLPHYYSSLVAQTVTFAKTVGGKVYMAGVGCKSGKRPWLMKLTDQNYPPPNGNGKTESQTITGSSPC